MTKAREPSDDATVVIGNGLSRKGLDLSAFCGTRTTLGCNALYREYLPHYLVAIDAPILAEIRRDRPATNLVETPYDDQFQPPEFNPICYRNSAGMVAMKYAIDTLESTRLMLLGMDFVLDSAFYATGNIFEGHPAYESNKTNFEETLKRCEFFDWFAARHPTVPFEFWFPSRCSIYAARISVTDNVSIKYFQVP